MGIRNTIMKKTSDLRPVFSACAALPVRAARLLRHVLIVGGAGLAEGRSMGGQAVIQLTGIAAVLLWSLVVSFVIAKVVNAVTELRVNAETEEQGLDLRLHGERGYNM